MTSLQSIVLSATEATITMPVAAEKPPRKATSAIRGASAASGSEITKVSGFTVSAKRATPAIAMGTIRTLKTMR